MNQGVRIARRLGTWLIAAGCWIAVAMPASADCTQDRCRILVAGDMGIGDDAFAAGFAAVQLAMVKDAPDLVLYAGDYIYTRQDCEWQAPPMGLPPYVAAGRPGGVRGGRQRPARRRRPLRAGGGTVLDLGCREGPAADQATRGRRLG